MRERKPSTKKGTGKFYLVREEILPKAIKKTIQVKEMIKREDVRTINDAVEAVDISRSAYYKYKDYVFPFCDASDGKVMSISVLLDHKAEFLSGVLSKISEHKGNIMTINQGLPLHDVADVNITIDTSNFDMKIEEFCSELRKNKGVRRVEIVGQLSK